jgi:hypothetical protein
MFTVSSPHRKLNSSIPDRCRQGDWGSVLRALSLCQDDSSYHPQIQEQVILELAENGDATLPLSYSVYKLDQITEEEEDKSKSSNNEKLSKARSLEHRLAQVASNPLKYNAENPQGLGYWIFGWVFEVVRTNIIVDYFVDWEMSLVVLPWAFGIVAESSTETQPRLWREKIPSCYHHRRTQSS